MQRSLTLYLPSDVDADNVITQDALNKLLLGQIRRSGDLERLHAECYALAERVSTRLTTCKEILAQSLHALLIS